MGRAGAAALTAGAIQNLFIGENAGATSSNSTGTTDYNTAVGYQTLKSLTSATFNTAIGANALLNNSTGINNTATGSGTLSANTTGMGNTATGDERARHQQSQA